MDLRELLRSLENDVKAGRYVKLFQEVRTRRSWLSSHRSPADVVAILTQYPTDRPAERERLCRALVEEQRNRPHPLWATMLVVAFARMLRGLRSQIHPGVLPSEDFSQVILTAFLQVVAGFPRVAPTGCTGIYLRQRTQRRLVRMLERVRREHGDRPLLPPARLEGTLGGGDVCAHLAAEEQDALAALLVTTASGAASVEPGHLRLLGDTWIQSVPLQAYVRRLYPHVEEVEAKRIYQRLKRQRTRTVNRLRTTFAALQVPRPDEQHATLWVESLLAPGGAPQPETRRGPVGP